MTEATLAVTAGSGTLLHTNTRTISSNTVHDEFTLPGEFPYATFFVQASSISVATSSDHVVQVMAGSTNPVRIRRIHFEQAANATTAAELTIVVLRLTTAGTGGTSITPAKFSTADSAAGATAMTLPTAKGTESTELFRRRIYLVQTVGLGGSNANQWEWNQLPNEEPLIIAAGTSNGIALKVATGRAAATADMTIELVETSFV